jgi:hypothetical protein
MASDEMITSTVEQYVKSKISRSAILLNGGWGEGKTYFINNSLIPVLQEKSGTRCYLISLFGLTTKSEIENELLGAFSYSDDNNLKRSFETACKSMSITLGDDARVTGGMLGGVMSAFFHIVRQKRIDKSENDTENTLFIFDDLERFLGDIIIPMAFVSRMNEILGAKCLIVCNEDRFISGAKSGEESRRQFDMFKEKTVGRCLSYEMTPEKIASAALGFVSQDNNLKGILKNIFDTYDLLGNRIFEHCRTKNLRKIKKTIYFIEDIYNLHKDKLYANPILAGELIMCHLNRYSEGKVVNYPHFTHKSFIRLRENDLRLIDYWLENGAVNESVCSSSIATWSTNSEAEKFAVKERHKEFSNKSIIDQFPVFINNICDNESEYISFRYLLMALKIQIYNTPLNNANYTSSLFNTIDKLKVLSERVYKSKTESDYNIDTLYFVFIDVSDGYGVNFQKFVYNLSSELPAPDDFNIIRDRLVKYLFELKYCITPKNLISELVHYSSVKDL